MENNTKKRKSTPRSKNGCRNCKLRRIKCDETRPQCTKCTKSGQICSGYEAASMDGSLGFHAFAITPSGPSESLPGIIHRKTQRAIDKTARTNQVGEGGNRPKCAMCRTAERPCDGSQRSCMHFPQDKAQPVRGWRVPTSYSPTNPTNIVSFKSPGTENERQLLYYFRTEAAQDLCGYGSPTFWKLALPSSHEEPVVLYAISALSAFHREKALRKLDVTQTPSPSLETVMVYTKALRNLQNYLSQKQRPSNKTVLVCCLLFYCLETAREEYSTARRHVKAGLEILKEWREKPISLPSNMNFGPLDDINELTELFASSDMVVSTSQNFTHPALTLTTPAERAGLLPPFPEKINGIEQLVAVVYKIQNWMFHCLATCVKHVEVPYNALPISMLNEQVILCEALEKLNLNIEHSTPNAHERTLIVQMAFECTKLIFHTCIHPPSTHPINITHYLDTILHLAETRAQLFLLPQGSTAQPKTFLFDPGSVGALVITGLMAEDEGRRRRSMDLMRIWPRLEGVGNQGTNGAGGVIEMAMKGVRERGLMEGKEEKLFYRKLVVEGFRDQLRIQLPPLFLARI